jgi:hypothetical protein
MTKKKRAHERDYIEDLRLTKSLLISTSLQKRLDVVARQLIEGFNDPLVFKPLQRLMIERKAWEHVRQLGSKPQLAFCHPAILVAHPVSSVL